MSHLIFHSSCVNVLKTLGADLLRDQDKVPIPTRTVLYQFPRKKYHDLLKLFLNSFKDLFFVHKNEKRFIFNSTFYVLLILNVWFYFPFYKSNVRQSLDAEVR